jgi:hemerythrin
MYTTTVPWNASFSLLAPALDDEHRTLLDKVNRLLSAISSGDETAILMAFSVLVAESRSHFAEEEERMRMLSYPDRERHCAQHEKLRSGLAGLQFTLGNTTSFASSSGPLVYLLSWFSEHLQTDDRRLAAFIHDRDSGAHARPMLRIV